MSPLPRGAQFGYIINTSLIHSFHQDFPSPADHPHSVYTSGMKLRTTRRHRVESSFSRGFERAATRISANNIISMSLIRVPFRALPSSSSFFIFYSSLQPLGILIASLFKVYRFFFITSSFLRGKSKGDVGLYTPRWNEIIDVYKNLDDSTLYAVQFKRRQVTND